MQPALIQTTQKFLVGAIAGVASLTLVSTSSADDFQPNRVSADAKWLAYINVEGILNSSLGKFMHEHGEALGFSMEGEDFEELEAQFGLNPMKDVRSATIYGEGVPEEGGSFIAIFETSAAVDDALAQLTAATEQGAEGAPPMETVELSGQKVSKIGEGDETAYVQIRPGSNSSERLVIFSMNQDWMSKGLRVLDGKGESLAGSEKAVIRHDIPDGVLVFASCHDLELVKMGLQDNDEPASAFLRDAKGVDFAFGELSGDTFFSLSLETGSKENAQNLSDIGRGLIGMARMAGNNEPEFKSLVEPLRSVQVKVEGANISVSVKHNSAKLVEALEAMAELADEIDGDDDDDDAGKVEIKASVGTKGGVKVEADTDKKKDDSQ